jgi:hypothetical protein
MSNVSDHLELSSSGTHMWGKTWASYVACIWAMLFTVAHIYRVFGGTAGLVDGKSVLEAGGVLLAIDVISIPMGISVG